MYAQKTYEKAKLILDKSSIGNLYNLRLSYRRYKFKAETLNCLLYNIDNFFVLYSGLKVPKILIQLDGKRVKK